LLGKKKGEHKERRLFSKFKWKRVQVNDTEGGPMGKWKRE
jgi:hypothetical protein